MRIRIPSSLRKLTGGLPVVEESAATVGDLIARLDARFPGLKTRVCEPDGQIKPYIHVFVNGQDVRNLQGMQTVLLDSDELIIAPAMAGG